MLPVVVRRNFFSFGRAAQASSAVEFALIAPVLLLLTFGLVAYAIYFGAAHSVQQLAADATRTSIAGLTDAERDRLVSNFIDANAGLYVLLDADHITYEVGDSPADPNQYRVMVSFDASELPIWNLSVPLPRPATAIRFASTIRKGGI